MKSRIALSVLTALAFASVAAPAAAHGDKKHKNLKVLDHSLGKAIGKGMKGLTKGLGVKCKACHVKGKLHLDDVAAKGVARDFIKTALMAPTPGEAQKKALMTLLKALKLDKAKNEAKIWAGVDKWRKK